MALNIDMKIDAENDGGQFDLAENSPVVIYGKTGSSRHRLVNSIIEQVIAQGGVAYLCDSRGEVAEGLDQDSVAGVLSKGVEDHVEIIKQAHAAVINGEHGNSVLVLNEHPALIGEVTAEKGDKAVQEVMDMLDYIIANGPAAGIFTVIATQEAFEGEAVRLRVTVGSEDSPAKITVDQS